MKINRSNYESYFLDFVEGNLSQEEMDELLDFLNENADLKQELDSFKMISLQPDMDEKLSWENLLKSEYDNQQIFDEACIRYVEGDMADSEKSEFIEYIEGHPQKKSDFEMFKKSRLVPDMSIKYPDTASLIHTPKLRMLWTGLAVAASLVLSVMIWNANPSNTTSIDPVGSEPLASNAEESIHESLIDEPDTVAIEEKQEDKDLKVLMIAQIVEPKKKTIIASDQPEQQKVEEEMYRKIEKMDLLDGLQPMATVEMSAMADLQLEDKTWDPEPIDQNRAVREQLLDLKITKNDIGLLTMISLKILSRDKIDYETTQQGKLSKIEYNSRLLAFSIPVNTHEWGENY